MKSLTKLSFAIASPPPTAISAHRGYDVHEHIRVLCVSDNLRVHLRRYNVRIELVYDKPERNVQFCNALGSESELPRAATFDKSVPTRVCSSLSLIEPRAPLPSKSLEYKSSVIAPTDML